MNKNNNHSTAPATLSSSLAACVLSAELGESEAVWLRRLHNWRRPTRASPLRWQESETGRPVYPREDLNSFIEAERAKRVRSEGVSGRAVEVMRAFGIGEEGGSRTGRRLDCTVHGQLDEQEGVGFVQVLVANPMLVFRLSIDEARTMASKLLAEAADAEHLQNIVKREAAS